MTEKLIVKNKVLVDHEIPYEESVELVIPQGVIALGENLFRGYKNLKSVTISNSVGCIDTAAFQSCTGLTSLVIPGSVKIICTCAFD